MDQKLWILRAALVSSNCAKKLWALGKGPTLALQKGLGPAKGLTSLGELINRRRFAQPKKMLQHVSLTLMCRD